jgi:hypothetical protein
MRRILLALILLFIITYSKGQLVKSIGLKGGVSIANQKWEVDGKYNSDDGRVNKTGFNLALTADFLKSKYFKFASDVTYCEKGHRIKLLYTTPELPEGDGSYIYFKEKANYLSLSVDAKPCFQIKNFIPYLVIGVRMDYQVSYNSYTSYRDIVYIKKSVFGINYGCGLEYKINKIGILLEFKHHKDLTPISDKTITMTSERLKIFNKATLLSAGIKYYFLKSE